MNLLQFRHFTVFLIQFVVLTSLLLATSAGFAAQPEKLDSVKTIRVVMDDNYPPYVFKGEQGELKGIIVDQWRLWEKQTGIATQLTGMDWSEAQRRMQAGEFDVIDTIFKTVKREAVLDFSNPYAKIDFSIFLHNDISGIRDASDLKGFLVGVKSGGAVIDLLKQRGIESIITFLDDQAIVEAARDEKIKVFVMGHYSALYFLNRLNIADRYRQTAPLFSGEFHRAVLKGNKDLLATVENGFAAISKSDLDNLDKRWMGSAIASSPYIRYAGYAAVVIAVFVVGLLAWLRLLKRAVARKTAELSKSEERLSLALNASSSGMWDWNVKTGSLYFDANYFTLSGYELDEFPHEYIEWEKRVHPDDVDQAKASIDACLSGKSTAHYVEFRFKNKDGSWSWFLGQGKVSECDADGNPVRFTGTHTDISERKRIEESLYESNAKLQAFYELGLVGLAITSPERGWIHINDCLCSMLGYSEAELRQMTWAQLTHPDDLAADVEQFERVLAGDIDGYELEKRFLTRGGETIFTRLVVRCVRKPDRTVDYIVAMVQDISEHKRFENELRDAEWKFQALFNNGPIGVAYHSMIYDDAGKAVDYFFIDANDNFIALTGVDPRGKTVTQAFPGIENDPFDWIGTFGNVARSGETINFEQHLQTNDRWYDMVGYQYKPDHFVASFVEITDRKRAEQERLNLEKQLLHAQKLESLGVLAGGIAHDFNNLLMAIMGNADLALMRLNPESPAVDNLHRIEQASARAADLAKQMLAYSGKGNFVVEYLDMSRLVEEMLHMLEVSITKKAVLRFNLMQPIPSVEADATQMRQIIMNLVINASEAIGDKSGVIAITTGCMDCDRNYLKDVWLDENLLGGLYVYLEIADSGCGMDKDTLSKLFDPFFTTKFTGRGLGMAAVLGIVRGHKGAIKVYSEPNKGTTFKILLSASDRPAELFNGHTHSDDWQGSGKVLLVDDEETVRGIGKEMLQELGFTVITADDGREGVAAFKENLDIAFVILDLTMPHMDGEQCFRELRQLKPDVKVIMSSGYSEQEVSEKFIGKGLAGFIQKPYKLSVLKDAVRNIS